MSGTDAVGAELNPTPEPVSGVLLGIGLAGLIPLTRRPRGLRGEEHSSSQTRVPAAFQVK